MRYIYLILLFFMVSVAWLACSDGPIAQACTDIPAGGCPLSRGLACADPLCEAAYACRPGNVWELRERCPTRAAPEDGGGDGAVDAPDARASSSFDASIDAPPGATGGPGCLPLQAPDCPLGLVLSCQGCCGCEDLFVCASGAWELWGVCGPAGPVPAK
jgi:hypothetical protein